MHLTILENSVISQIEFKDQIAIRKNTRRRVCALLSVHGADLDIKI
jgi:hypothetical protein